MKIYYVLLLALALIAPAAANEPSSTIQSNTPETHYITDATKVGFSIYQGNRLVKASLENGYLTYRLKNQKFTIKTKFKWLKIYLSEEDIGEFRQDNNKIHILSSALTAAANKDSDLLIIADHTDPYGSNTLIGSFTGLKTTGSFESFFDVKILHHEKSDKDIRLSNFYGKLFGYVWVDFDNDGDIGIDEVSRIKLIIAK